MCLHNDENNLEVMGHHFYFQKLPAETELTYIAEVAGHKSSVLHGFVIQEVQRVLMQEARCGAHVQA